MMMLIIICVTYKSSFS